MSEKDNQKIPKTAGLARNICAYFIPAAILLAAYVTAVSLNWFVDFDIEQIKDVAVRAASLTLMFCVLFALLAIYVRFYPPAQVTTDKAIKMILTIVVLTFVISQIAAHYVNLYVMPAALAALLIATLLERRLGILANILVAVMTFLSTLLVSNDASTAQMAGAIFTSVVTGTFLVLSNERLVSRLQYLKRGLSAASIAAPVSFAVSLIAKMDYLAALISAAWAFGTAIVVVIVFMSILPILERMFRTFTAFRLYEICSFNTPLLERLQEEAPGTFNHSITVGNYAEQCAIAIGENAQLARAAGYYHDVGKLKNPEIFVENQKGYNPHDDLIPEVSVKMISEHTDYGAKLIKESKYLSDELANIALQHHGTTAVAYFYYKAQNVTEEQLAQREFSYNNPTPSTKIAAIVMIADTVEAATRARGGIQDADELKKFITSLVDEKIKQNQFANCPITLRDIEKIIDTLVSIVPSVFHSRISYANNK